MANSMYVLERVQSGSSKNTVLSMSAKGVSMVAEACLRKLSEGGLRHSEGMSEVLTATWGAAGIETFNTLK